MEMRELNATYPELSMFPGKAYMGTQKYISLGDLTVFALEDMTTNCITFLRFPAIQSVSLRARGMTNMLVFYPDNAANCFSFPNLGFSP